MRRHRLRQVDTYPRLEPVGRRIVEYSRELESREERENENCDEKSAVLDLHERLGDLGGTWLPSQRLRGFSP